MKQLIFDCDGVLVDTEIMAAEVMVNLLRSYGVDIDITGYIEQFTGKTFTGILESLNITFNQDIEAVSKETERLIYSNLKEIPGMSALLFRQSLPISIVSNSATWQVKKAVSFLGIEILVNSNLFSSEMVDLPKPFPDIYLQAAQVRNVKPAECLVVEDSLSGATSALEAGMNVIGFCGASHIQEGHDQRLLELGVIKTAQNAKELDSVIAELT